MGPEEQTDLFSRGAPSRRSLLILYGTETGKSQEIAQELGEAAERLRFQCAVEQMNDVSLRELVQYPLAIFVTSTTGQGDVPANAATFWKNLLRRKLPPTCLSQLQFTVFGLGDSSYPRFNWAARKLQKRLLQLGAIEFYPAGEGDERHDNGIDSIYLPWIQGLKAFISTNLPLPDGTAPIPDDELLPPKYPIGVADMDPMSSLAASLQCYRWADNREKNAALSHIDRPVSAAQQWDDEELRLNNLSGFGELARADDQISRRITKGGWLQLDKENILKDHPQKYDLCASKESDASPPTSCLPIPGTFYSKLIFTERVTPQDHWQDVRMLTIEITKSICGEKLPSLKPGDSIVIFPKNFPADVQTLINMMDWQSVADKKVMWNVQGERPRCPRNMHARSEATLRDLLTHNIDFNAIPNRTFLKHLQRHTKDEREKERLAELTQESNTQEFYDYTSRPRRTILEVLQDFPGVHIPMEYALETFPIIRGRAFSIANCDLSHLDNGPSRLVEILVALVEYKTIIRKPRQGLCSRYIKSLREGTRLVVGIAGGNSPPRGESNAHRPLIAVATGTGIAPVRSLLQDRALWGRKSGSAMLFFGCRNKKADFHFQNEWLNYSKLKVIPAFSRDPIAAADQVFLDPYLNQDKTFLKPEIVVNNIPEPMGPQNTPWLRSFDYDRGKMYVQHQIRRHSEDICSIVRQAMKSGTAPIIMICGNAGRMPTSVRHALEDALVIGGVADDNDIAKRMLQQFGIWMETW